MGGQTISAPHGRLEIRVKEPSGTVRAAAVLCHPHPQHGGTMNTKSLYHTSKALQEVGVVAVRFNFRGVGQSTGQYDHGLGERDDVRLVLDWTRKQYPDVDLVLGGHSFGSYVALTVAREEQRVRGCLGMGLPLDMYDYSFLETLEKPTLLVQGERDEFTGGPVLRERFGEENPRLHIEIIEQAGHLFDGYYGELRSRIQRYFSSGEGRDLLQRSVPSGGKGIP